MNNITEHIKSRRSVRTYNGRDLDKSDIEKLTAFAQTIENPFKIPVDLTAKEYNLNVVFEQNDPKLETAAEYIASFKLV